MAVTPPEDGGPTGLILLGVLFFLLGVLFVLVEGSLGLGPGLLLLILAFALIGVAIVWKRSLKPSYHVAIASSSGETNAFTSQNREYIGRIVNSINDAIVKYR